MNDLLRRIAEIEGALFDGKSYSMVYEILEGHPGFEDYWNPLESWADCGPLIEKYPIEINPWHEKDNYVVAIWEDDYSDIKVIARDPDLRTAIVRAIVETHEETQAQ